MDPSLFVDYWYCCDSWHWSYWTHIRNVVPFRGVLPPFRAVLRLFFKSIFNAATSNTQTQFRKNHLIIFPQLSSPSLPPSGKKYLALESSSQGSSPQSFLSIARASGRGGSFPMIFHNLWMRTLAPDSGPSICCLWPWLMHVREVIPSRPLLWSGEGKLKRKINSERLLSLYLGPHSSIAIAVALRTHIGSFTHWLAFKTFKVQVL